MTSSSASIDATPTHESVRRLRNVAGVRELYEAIRRYGSTHGHVLRSLETLESAVRLFGVRNMSVAFNGGKDATIVFYLTLAAIFGTTTRSQPHNTKLHCIYLEGEQGSGENFPTVDEFVRTTVTDSLELVDCSTVQMGILQGLRRFIEDRKETLCAFVMGTRRTDPHGKHMERFEPSSPTWPPFMRVNPILDWTYRDVWGFIHALNLPFCELYARGYTSIGSVSTTNPNPTLLREKGKVQEEGEKGEDVYDPAWMLEDEGLERAGRVPRPKT